MAVGADESGQMEVENVRRDKEEQMEDENHSDFGERQPRVGRRPNAPTRKEIDEHFPLHANYRSWCPHCQAGRSTSRQHRCNHGDDVLGPCISIDYAFKYDEEKEESTAPVLVTVDKSKGTIWALQVDAKGVDNGAGAKWLCDRLDFAGYRGTKITIMSDQEPSIVALKDAVAVRRTGETAFVESPVRQSKCNSLVERAIRNWRDQYRTLRHFLEHRMGAKLREGDALSSWLVVWAAEVINKYRVQASGRTAYELMTNHRCKRTVVGFGEKVYFQHVVAGKDDYRKDVGIFLGIDDRLGRILLARMDVSMQVLKWYACQMMLHTTWKC